MLIVTSLQVPFSALPQFLLAVIIAAVLLSFLQYFLCKKNADQGIPLIICSGSFSALMFISTLFGSHDSSLSWTLAAFGKGLLNALLVLLISGIPMLALILLYRSAKKKEG